MTTACFRFYGELNRFLAIKHRGLTFRHTVKGHPAVKDTLEALGVPHPEVDVILVNGKPADFSYQLKGAENIAVYPYGYTASRKVKHLVPKPAGRPRFVVDSHLGKLVRHLRLLGFDSLYKKVFPDDEIVALGTREKRVILTRDTGLLKNKAVRFGCWLYDTGAEKQIRQLDKRYNLRTRIKPFSLCLECNGKIVRIAKSKVIDRLPPKVRLFYNKFYLCKSCLKIYWQGSHYDKMMKLVNQVRRFPVRK